MRKNKDIDYLRFQDKVFLVICNIFNHLDKEYRLEQKQKKRDKNHDRN